ncbi:MAG: nucleotide-binding universal stress UspA family protein [Saprospiraceae bacterium]|jgi:nucleotide-binding universal stress UspA family protein
MKNILFPTDFSKAAKNAFVYALKVAEKMNAQITILHVNQMPVLEVEGNPYPADIERIQESLEMEEMEAYKNGLTALKAIAKELGLETIPLQHIMEYGKVQQTIIKVADEYDIDFIVMGTKGTGWLKEVFFGSNTGEVLEHANCPVLAVPEKATFDNKIDKIAVTTEFLKKEKKVIREVLKFASWFDAVVHIINIDISHTHFYTKKMDELKKEFESFGDIHFIVINSDNLLEGLAQYLENNSFDIVGMTTHKRSFIQELFNYSKAKAMTYQYNIPVLSIPTHTV